jgi:hypothetical protein
MPLSNKYLTVYVRLIPYKTPVLVPISAEMGTKLGLFAVLSRFFQLSFARRLQPVRSC